MDNIFEQAVALSRVSAAASQAGIEIGRREASGHLRAIVAAYDSLTDYERMILPERFRIAIEKGRDK